MAPFLALLTATLTMTAAIADDAKYPDWKGQWNRQSVRGLPGQPSFDPFKGWAKFQQAPLTAEYETVLETNLKAQQQGGFFDWRGAS